jgi:hypothetical protein
LSAVAHINEYKTGRFYTDEFRGDMSWNGYENNNLLRNEGCAADGTPRFTDVAMALGADDEKDGRGVAVADFDNDGDLDIAVNHNPGDSGDASRAQATLLRNDIGAQRHWLAVELVGTQSNRDAVGAELLLESGDLRQLRLVTAGSSYASQHHQRIYFGLGDHQLASRLEVRWPSGLVETLDDLEAGWLVRLEEGVGEQILRLPGAESPLAGRETDPDSGKPVRGAA